MAQYWYDKYALIQEYVESTEPGSFKIQTENVLTEDLGEYAITVTISDNFWFHNHFKTAYDVKTKTQYGDFNACELILSGEEKPIGDVHGQDVFYKFDTITYNRQRHTGLFEYRVYSKIIIPRDPLPPTITVDLQIMKRVYLEEISIFERNAPGGLLEKDLILDDSYPIDGPKNGYWWTRKGLYTIPPPILISPQNSLWVNIVEGEEIPHLTFQLVPREANDSNLYHVRVRLGTQTDFLTHNIERFESKEDLTGWEILEGTEWVPFPAEGVPAGTICRIKPDTSKYEFGFIYWSATAHNPQWGYGAEAQHRMIIIVDDAGKFVLMINGRRYNPMQLNVSESSNGELGSMDIVLDNHNI